MLSKFCDVVLGIAVGAFVEAPVKALLTMWSAATIWTWFMQPQFGPGPSYMAWLGIGYLIGLLTIRDSKSLTEPDDEDELPITLQGLIQTLAYAAIVLLTVGTSWLVKAMIW